MKEHDRSPDALLGPHPRVLNLILLPLPWEGRSHCDPEDQKTEGLEPGGAHAGSRPRPGSVSAGLGAAQPCDTRRHLPATQTPRSSRVQNGETPAFLEPGAHRGRLKTGRWKTETQQCWGTAGSKEWLPQKDGRGVGREPTTEKLICQQRPEGLNLMSESWDLRTCHPPHTAEGTWQEG